MRTGAITVTNGEGIQTIYIHQDGINSWIEVSETAISSNANGKTGSITVNSNVNWVALSDEDWVELDFALGEGNEVLPFVIAANDTGATRTATITITGEGVVRTITVTQTTTIAQPPITVTWNAMGGHVWPTSQQLIPGTPFGTLPTPTWPHHTFNGWWTTASGAGTQLQPSSIVPNSNTGFFARWTFDPSGLDQCHHCGAFALLDEGWWYECFACGAWAIINPREQLD